MLARSRHTLRLAAIGVLVSAPLLASCGFDEATNRINQITAGTTVHADEVTLSNVVIVSEEEGSGTLHGLVASRNADDVITLTGVEGEGVTATDGEIELEPYGRGQLEEAGLRIDGEPVAPGRVLPMTFVFDDGSEVPVDVFVKRACGQYTGLDDAPSADLEIAPSAGAEPADEAVEQVPCPVDEPEPHGEEGEEE
ncbi:hypothetical protein [Nocardioides nanhaiensis]|uniref:Copper chaperone PCu(A)C n=1 Tax=Nocardioides nanhaiensis TaxID=1476871 RepID=A0ABP8VVX5_9ACTN